jgi:hypothetical protein
MEIISKSARKEIIGALRTRYQQASKEEKGMILGEFTAVTGFHRKHAIRLLKAAVAALVKKGIENNMPSQRIYDEAVKAALIVLWEAADRICGKRLKAAIPILLDAMERHGHLRLDPEIRQKVMAVSAATIDRVLIPMRQTAGSRRRRHGKKKVSKGIPIKTFSDWKDPAPGFLEIDFVVHGGGSMSGEYLHSFVVTDVCSGWVEAVPLLAREQKLVIEGINVIRGQLPVPVRGIDSDNDGAFINETLTSYCQEAGICFTRSRPHHKNDQAWIEQKNGAVIRKMVGHERLSGIVAGQALAHLLQAVRLYVNIRHPLVNGVREFEFALLLQLQRCQGGEGFRGRADPKQGVGGDRFVGSHVGLADAGDPLRLVARDNGNGRAGGFGFLQNFFEGRLQFRNGFGSRLVFNPERIGTCGDEYEERCGDVFPRDHLAKDAVMLIN